MGGRVGAAGGFRGGASSTAATARCRSLNAAAFDSQPIIV
jgi:hypothetical protein